MLKDKLSFLKPSFISSLVIIGILFYSQMNIKPWKNAEKQHSLIDWDVTSYYAYLPAYFMQTCYKLIPTRVIKSINLVEKRFAFDPEITAKLAKNKQVKFAEVPISYTPRNHEEGKKIRWVDGFNQIFSILKYGLFK